jgi:hypothetical protein
LAFAFGLRAGTIFTDGFESYQLGSLDKNITGGPNAAANGTGNPWFGPAPPNLQVVNAENGVTPHGGTKMIRGRAPSDFDENWVNIAYRFNGGTPYTGNVQFDWWFYDPNGATNGSAYRDFGAIGYYDAAPGNTDYPGTGSLNGSSVVERLSVGASSDTGGAYNPLVYQVRVVGTQDGYDGGTGWYNTPVARTVGWHHAEVVVGARAADGSNPVSFYIDNLTAPAFTAPSTVVNAGYNVLEVNGDYGTTPGYFDDVSFGTVPVPEPAAVALLALGGLVVVRRRRR